MDQEILDFLKTQRVGVLAVEMPDGSPHAATVHFAHAENPLVFYFETNRNYRKSKALFGRSKSRASFVVGTSESMPVTMQLDGEVELIGPEEVEAYNAVYLGKFPEKQKKLEDSSFVNFKFTPAWWRYTNFKSPEGKKIVTSEQ